MTQENHPPYTQDPGAVPGAYPYPEQPGSFSRLPRFFRQDRLLNALTVSLLIGSGFVINHNGGNDSPAFASAESSPSATASAQPQSEVSTPTATASPIETPTQTASPSETTSILPPATPTPTAISASKIPEVPIIFNYDTATQNLHLRTGEKGVEGANNVIKSAGIAALQELAPSTWKKLISGGYLCDIQVKGCRYMGYFPQLDPKATKSIYISKNAVVWNTEKYELMEDGYSTLNKPSNDLGEGAGGSNISLRLMPHITLMPKELGDTNVRVVVWVFHMVASVETHGVANTEHHNRLIMYAHQSDTLAKSIEEYNRIFKEKYPDQITIHVVAGDSNWAVNRSDKVYKDNYEHSPVETCVKRLDMKIINLDKKAPLTGTLPKTGNREVDITCVTDNEQVQTELTSFTYFPRGKGEKAGSNYSDHIGYVAKLKSTITDNRQRQNINQSSRQRRFPRKR